MESDKMIMLELKDRTGGRDSVMCSAARHELDCPGFETSCETDSVVCRAARHELDCPGFETSCETDSERI